jgi:putative ABC transport system substrate-binding protein
MLDVRRRDFITLLGGAAAWPLAARAQQRERMRRIGVLMNLTPDDAEGQARLAAFLQGLQEAGWAVGRNVRIDLRWGGGDAESFRKQAAELVALAPDVVLASGIPAATPLLQATRTVPIVFAQVVDPVGAGLVSSLSRPSGNATGFTSPEYGFAGKWVELIKEMAPGVTRVAILRDATSSSGIGYMGAVRLAASSFGMELTPVGITDAGEIERGVTAFTRLERRPDCDGEHVDHGSSRADYHARCSAPTACGLCATSLCQRWRLNLLWPGFDRPISARGRLRRSYPQGR